MASIFDVAQFFLQKIGSVTAMKLQKLCYYAQAWSLAWDEGPLFEEKIEAWTNGPVISELYNAHKGLYKIYPQDIQKGDVNNLTDQQKDVLLKVIQHYNKYNSQQLSDLTHLESPWRDARHGLSQNERGRNEITHASLAEYYSSLN